MTAIGEFDPLATGQIVAAMSKSAPREDLLVKMIPAGRSLDATLEGLGVARPATRSSNAVREALVARAAREGSMVNARRDLEAAAKWKRGKTKLSDAAQADLQSVLTQHPDLRHLELNP